VIKIGGVDINTLPRAKLRRITSLAPQQSMLFSGTARDNILWGNGAASADEMTAAAKAAHADDFIAPLKTATAP
jgi:ABC-type multidrug transport system fused ATPase/permease subunit